MVKLSVVRGWRDGACDFLEDQKIRRDEVSTDFDLPRQCVTESTSLGLGRTAPRSDQSTPPQTTVTVLWIYYCVRVQSLLLTRPLTAPESSTPRKTISTMASDEQKKSKVNHHHHHQKSIYRTLHAPHRSHEQTHPATMPEPTSESNIANALVPPHSPAPCAPSSPAARPAPSKSPSPTRPSSPRRARN